MQIPLQYKLLKPVPKIEKAFEVYQFTKLKILPKHICIQADAGNSGFIYLADSADAFDVASNPDWGFEILAAGERKIYDIDQNRNVGVDLSTIYFTGTSRGDRLVVTYLEEKQDGQD